MFDCCSLFIVGICCVCSHRSVMTVYPQSTAQSFVQAMPVNWKHPVSIHGLSLFYFIYKTLPGMSCLYSHVVIVLFHLHDPNRYVLSLWAVYVSLHLQDLPQYVQYIRGLSLFNSTYTIRTGKKIFL